MLESVSEGKLTLVYISDPCSWLWDGHGTAGVPAGARPLTIAVPSAASGMNFRPNANKMTVIYTV